MTIYGHTPDGQEIDDAMIERLAANAEAGFPGARLTKPRGGRPAMGERAAATISVRLEPSLELSLDQAAAAEHRDRSEIIRDALRSYLGAA